MSDWMSEREGWEGEGGRDRQTTDRELKLYSDDNLWAQLFNINATESLEITQHTKSLI